VLHLCCGSCTGCERLPDRNMGFNFALRWLQRAAEMQRVAEMQRAAQFAQQHGAMTGGLPPPFFQPPGPR